MHCIEDPIAQRRGILAIAHVKLAPQRRLLQFPAARQQHCQSYLHSIQHGFPLHESSNHPTRRTAGRVETMSQTPLCSRGTEQVACRIPWHELRNLCATDNEQRRCLALLSPRQDAQIEHAAQVARATLVSCWGSLNCRRQQTSDAYQIMP